MSNFTIELILTNWIATLAPEFAQEHELTVHGMIENLTTTQVNFCPDKSLVEIFRDECRYYTQHGMSAFDCGYCGKELREEKYFDCVVENPTTGERCLCQTYMVNDPAWIFTRHKA